MVLPRNILSIVPSFLSGFFGQAGAQSQYGRQCISDGAANRVAQNYGHLFSAFSPQFADQVLTPDIMDQSDSVNWLISNGTNCPKPLGTPTERNRRDFIQDQSTQPDMPFTVENVYHDCTNVFVRWKFDSTPQSPMQVQGIAILGTRFQGYNSNQPYLISHIYAEFNTGAFLENLGYYRGTSPCASGRNLTLKRDADDMRLGYLPTVG